MTAKQLIRRLRLKPLVPEGGFFRETYRARETVIEMHRRDTESAKRNADCGTRSAEWRALRLGGETLFRAERRRACPRHSRRALSTSIYYLLTPDCPSRLHRLPGAEVFHFYLGDPVTMLLLYPDGKSAVITLGPDIACGQRVQQVVAGRVWQGALLKPGAEFALLGTTMAPGFDPDDYEPGIRRNLVRRYPRRKALITRLT